MSLYAVGKSCSFKLCLVRSLIRSLCTSSIIFCVSLSMFSKFSDFLSRSTTNIYFSLIYFCNWSSLAIWYYISSDVLTRFFLVTSSLYKLSVSRSFSCLRDYWITPNSALITLFFLTTSEFCSLNWEYSLSASSIAPLVLFSFSVSSPFSLSFVLMPFWVSSRWAWNYLICSSYPLIFKLYSLSAKSLSVYNLAMRISICWTCLSIDW
jgi:hypothetical protein